MFLLIEFSTSVGSYFSVLWMPGIFLFLPQTLWILQYWVLNFVVFFYVILDFGLGIIGSFCYLLLGFFRMGPEQLLANVAPLLVWFPSEVFPFWWVKIQTLPNSYECQGYWSAAFWGLSSAPDGFFSYICRSALGPRLKGTLLQIRRVLSLHLRPLLILPTKF